MLKATLPSAVQTAGYGLIYIHTMPMVHRQGEGAQILAVSGVAVGVRLTIEGSQLIHQGQISELATGEIIAGQTIEIITTFKNSGNHHFRAKGEIAVMDSGGNLLAKFPNELTSGPILPTYSRQLRAFFIPEGELPLGRYLIYSKVMLEDGSVLDEEEGSFEVARPYAPPIPEAKSILSAAETFLRTPDGVINIHFPAGSVSSDVNLEVSIRTYPHSQLSAPPQDYSLGATCFRIDGIPGLLLKDADLSVKYSDEDLALAEGDAHRLELARWDEAESKWIVMPTYVNEENTVLATSTNHFSLWAVLIAPRPIHWAPIIFAALIGFIVLLIAITAHHLAKKSKSQ